MLFVTSFLLFFQSHYSAVVNWVIMSSRVDSLAIRYFVRIAKDVSTRPFQNFMINPGKDLIIIHKYAEEIIINPFCRIVWYLTAII